MALTHTAYGMKVKVDLPYEQAVEKTKAALKEQGFGVLTEIDVKKTMKEKLNVDFRRYVIIGACNPPLAHKALSSELDLGLMLPCNVIVYEENHGSVVAGMDPVAALGVVQNPALQEVAKEARERVSAALEKVEKESR
ncbi:MAG: DUF302 domain-containing protein [Chloroflexi bacterium]|nr:DUF302 domain-containing protein [Chloroflexota bacterium]